MNKATEETMGGVWKPGDKVWYKSRDGFEPQPELFTVVAEDGSVVWVKDELQDMLVFSDELTPYVFTKEKKDEIG